MADDPIPSSEPTPVEASGLLATRLAARVRQALYHVPAAELAQIHERIRSGSVERHLDYFADGSVRTIRVLPVPMTMLAAQRDYLHGVVRTLHRALLRMPELYLCDAQVRALLRLEPEEDEWLRSCWTPSLRSRNPIFDRLDALVDYTSPVWKETLRFVEPNLTGVGGLYLIPAVEEVVEQAVVPFLGAQDPGLRLSRLADAREVLLRTLTTHLAAIGRPGGLICLVEPKYEMEGIDEQRRLVEYYHRRHGIELLHADPSELRMRGGEVYCGDRQVDLVYRDYSVLDLVELEHAGTDVTPMRTLFRDNRVISSIAGELDHKSCWEVLTDPALAERYFTEADRRVFQRHVLWTRVVSARNTLLPSGASGDLLDYIRRDQESLVLKPSRGYGGDGVLIGQTADAPVWERAVEAALADPELWVVQRLAQIPAVEVPTLTEDGLLHPEPFYHVMGFASDDLELAVLARASQRQVVNVAQRGGMAAVMLVEEV